MGSVPVWLWLLLLPLVAAESGLSADSALADQLSCMASYLRAKHRHRLEVFGGAQLDGQYDQSRLVWPVPSGVRVPV